MQREAPPEAWHPPEEKFGITLWSYTEDAECPQVTIPSNCYWQALEDRLICNPYPFRIPPPEAIQDYYVWDKPGVEWPPTGPITLPVKEKTLRSDIYKYIPPAPKNIDYQPHRRLEKGEKPRPRRR